MKINLFVLSLFAAGILTLTSCQAIGDIFKAGVWVGVIVVVVIVALVLWLISKATK